MNAEQVVITSSGMRHAVERAYGTGRSRVACGRVVWGQRFPSDHADVAAGPMCSKCRRIDWERTQLHTGFARIEDGRVETARGHEYERDLTFTATSTGNPPCRACGEPERYHR